SGELLETDRRSQSGRASADDHHIELHRLPFHPPDLSSFSIRAVSLLPRLCPLLTGGSTARASPEAVRAEGRASGVSKHGPQSPEPLAASAAEGFLANGVQPVRGTLRDSPLRGFLRANGRWNGLSACFSTNRRCRPSGVRRFPQW